METNRKAETIIDELDPTKFKCNACQEYLHIKHRKANHWCTYCHNEFENHCRNEIRKHGDIVACFEAHNDPDSYCRPCGACYLKWVKQKNQKPS